MTPPMIPTRPTSTRPFATARSRSTPCGGVDLTIATGEMVAIMGPSGCGKTTLLNCLSGLDNFDAGEVLIEGANLPEMGDRARTDYRARRMGFVFQTFNLLPVITAVENVELPLLVTGVKPRDARAEALDGAGPGGAGRPGPTTGRPSSPAASASASPSPGRWSTTRPSSGPTSRPATWTARPRTTSSASCALNREAGPDLCHRHPRPAIGALCDRIVRMQDGEIVDHGGNGDPHGIITLTSYWARPTVDDRSAGPVGLACSM